MATSIFLNAVVDFAKILTLFVIDSGFSHCQTFFY